MREFRIYGPPGTGKTRELATKTIPEAVKLVGEDGVLVTSYTKAAAREIAGRDLPIPEWNVGTLHAMCYRQMGRPEIAQAHLDEWNEQHPKYQLTGGYTFDVDEVVAVDAPPVDDLLHRSDVLRNKMMPERDWSYKVHEFYAEWSRWKTLNGYVDYTDMIESGSKYTRPQGDIRIIIVDEAQDLTPLQLKLVRSWGLSMDWFILVGDPDQCIYSFAGSTPRAFINPPVEEKYKKVLGQSYRVPRKIHEYAVRFIQRNMIRENYTYLPRPADGAISSGPTGANYKKVDRMIPIIEDRIGKGQRVMILASCSYMLDPYRLTLRKEGIPFHNPYRRRRGDWNPLALRGEQTTTAKILASYLAEGPDKPYWTIEQLLGWAPYILVGEDGLIRKTGAKAIKALEQIADQGAPGLQTSRGVLAQVLEQNAMEHALSRSTEWLQTHLRNDRVKTLGYPLAVIKRGGLEALRTTPKVILGTIHSVKGGEADVVILHPDLSRAGAKDALVIPESAEALRRMFYVGMTRAKSELIIAEAANGPAHGEVRYETQVCKTVPPMRSVLE